MKKTARSFYIVLVVFEMVVFAKSRPHLKHQSKTTSNNTETSRVKTRILTNPNRRVVFGNENAEQEIVFPDDVSSEHTEFGPKIDGVPKCAAGSTFCEDFDSYPYQQLKEVLQKNKVNKILFGEDESPQEIANRIGEDEDKFMCRAYRKTVYPKIGRTKDDQWKFIINQGAEDGYVQGVLIETCVNLEGPCDIIGDLPLGVTTSCKQKFVYRRMMSLSDTGQPAVDTFKLPSACCCSYRTDFGFMSRLGKPVSPTR